jgi:hypothetical protein
MYTSFQIFDFHVGIFSFCLTVVNNVIHVNEGEENEDSRQQIPEPSNVYTRKPPYILKYACRLNMNGLKTQENGNNCITRAS